MNEIFLRTNKCEYKPGDDIYGVVYLKIASATGGRGVRLKFLGCEKFVYEYKNAVLTDSDSQKFEECRHHVSYNETLFESDEPLYIRSTLIPFKISLPSEIPGTFEACNETEVVRWHASMKFSLEVSVIDAEYLKIVQAIMVFEALSQRLCKANIPEAVSVSYRRTLAILFTSQINVTARLFEHTNRSAENLQLRIIISNNTNKAVKSLKIKLLRYIHLLGKWREMITPCEDARVMRNGDRVEIAVESGESVIREQLLDMEHFQQGVDNIQIPLRGCDNTPLPPTVNGHHIQCWYEVQLEVTLSNDDKVDLKVPVAVIWPPKNKEWGKWKCPQWVAKEALNIDIYHTTSVLRVPQNLLSSPAFSSIPGFNPT
ncbi:uncharacterized protein LOC128214409 [Mya arenaria]|uniref:uncharacterized protein LOC128214409 n=1 Tax=Mya arenaria TaxID=6604 RepID=UPI0022E3A1E0|nr:uncharacterized protein LOC128214409 [Mya arenaria]